VFNVRSHVISVSWLPTIAVAAWWAGFMPFPTRPESVGIEQKTPHYKGIADADPLFFLQERFVTAAVADSRRKQCEDTRTGDPQADENFTITCWRVSKDIPFYGLGAPGWILEYSSMSYANPNKGESIGALAMYRSYAACMWAKKHVDAELIEGNKWSIEHDKTPPDHTYFHSCEKAP
jgi:hypothetical protein